MKGRGTLLIVLASFALLSLSPEVLSAPVVSVSPSSMKVSQGQIFTVNITVDPKGNEIYGVQYDLYFDNGILKAISQTQGTFLGQDGAETYVFVNETDNTVGIVKYGESRIGVKNGVTSPGILSTISFEVVGTSGKSDLKLSNVKLSDATGKSVDAEIEDGVCIVGEAVSEPAFKNIKVEEVKEMINANPNEIILLDVRTDDEYNAEHIYIEGIELKHIPLSELESRLDELDKTKKVIVYSEKGVNSKNACKILAERGFEVYNLLGGIKAWRVIFPKDLFIALTSPATTASANETSGMTKTPTPTASPTISGFEAFLLALATIVTIILYSKERKRRGK